MANYLVVLEVMLAFATIIGVKGQPTAQVCENGDSSNSIEAELSLEAIQQLNIQLQSIREILTEANQGRKHQQDTLMTSLQAVNRRSQNQNESIHQFLNASLMGIKNQLNVAMTSLQAVDRRSQEQDIYVDRFRNFHDFLNTSFEGIQNHGVSFQEIKDQLDNVTASLQVIYRRSQMQDVCIKQVQSKQELLNASFQQLINQLNTVVTSLQVIDRRSQEQDIYIKQIHRGNENHNDSFQQMKNQINTAMTSLQTDYRRSHDQTESIRKFLQNASLVEMNNKQNTLLIGIEAIDRRSQEQEIYIKQIQRGNELINASVQQVENQLHTALKSLQADDRRSQDKIETIYGFLNLSFQQMKNQQDTVLRKLEAIGRDLSIKNQTLKNYWKLEIAQVTDVGEVPVLQPIVSSWIVLMHRFNGSMNFNRSWNEYKNGFGDIGRGEFWIGNEKIYRLTNRFACTLRIEMYINGTWYYAEYSNFSIDSESNKFTLRLSGYSGNAANSLAATYLGLSGNLNEMGFTTWDVDNDRYSGYNCASRSGGGWWFNSYINYACLTCSYDGDFRWQGLIHKEPSHTGRLRAARMMIKSK